MYISTSVPIYIMRNEYLLVYYHCRIASLVLEYKSEIREIHRTLSPETP